MDGRTLSTYPIDTLDATDFIAGTNAAGDVKLFAGSSFGLLGGTNTWTGVNTFSNDFVGSDSINIKIGTEPNTSGAAFIVARNIAGASNSHGYDDTTQFGATGGNTAYASFNAQAAMIGANNYNHYVAFQSVGGLTTSGATTTFAGLVHSPQMTAGVLTNSYGVYVSDIALSGGATNTTQYGVFINSLASAANNWSIYCAGPALSYFGGNVTFADSISVGGDITVTAGSVNIPTGHAYNYNGVRIAWAQTALGNWWFGGAGSSAPTGTGNVGLGAGALQYLTSGSNNCALGVAALAAATASVNNIAIGTGALQVTDGAGQNVGIGTYALNAHTAGYQNVGIGYAVLIALIDGNTNTGIGVSALPNLNHGSGNTAIGYGTGAGITTGGNNTIIGANVAGLASGLASNIILADGTGAIKARWDGSANWSLAGTVAAATAYKVGADQVVGARDTGWTAMTGTPDKATPYATSTVTLAQLAGRVAELQAILTAHGLIGV